MEYRKLGDYCEVKGGKRLPKGEQLVEYETNHPYLRISDYSNGSVNLNNLKYVTEETFQKISRYIINEGDIFLSIVGTIGIVDFIDYKLDSASLTENAVRIRSFNESVLSTKFLSYFLKSDQGQNEMFIRTVGSTQPKLAITRIKDINIPIIDIKSQQKISNILSTIDEKITLNKNLIANLEELSQTLFKRWFVDFEFPDENGNPYKSSGGEMVDSELGEIPINWNLVKLGSIANIRTGYAFKSTEYIEQIQLPVLRTLNISKSNLLVTMNDIKFVPYQYLYMDKYQKYNLELFDTLLVTVGGSIGNLGLVTENNLPSLQNQNMWRFRSIKSNISNTLIYQLILYVNSLVYNQTSGSAREFYTKKTFENFNLLLPKLDSYLYESINKYLENFGKKISDLNVEIEKLTQLRDTLLPKLMSGEIEIPDHIEVNEDELSI